MTPQVVCLSLLPRFAVGHEHVEHPEVTYIKALLGTGDPAPTLSASLILGFLASGIFILTPSTSITYCRGRDSFPLTLSTLAMSGNDTVDHLSRVCSDSRCCGSFAISCSADFERQLSSFSIMI
ncbi:hypothetical protein H4582DRAFT_252929 [Lactarius indigo]|nr:hypothetical protein H4582DRAFT_252929 [Lactarius indigo]